MAISCGLYDGGLVLGVKLEFLEQLVVALLAKKGWWWFLLSGRCCRPESEASRSFSTAPQVQAVIL